MEKRLFLITGTTSGLGFETLKKLAKMDIQLVVANRNLELSKKQVQDISSETGNHLIESMRLICLRLNRLKTLLKITVINTIR